MAKCRQNWTLLNMLLIHKCTEIPCKPHATPNLPGELCKLDGFMLTDIGRSTRFGTCKNFCSECGKSWDISTNLCFCLIPASRKIFSIFHLTEIECRPFKELFTDKFKINLALQICTKNSFLLGLSRSILLAP